MAMEHPKTRALLSAIAGSDRPMTLSDPRLPDHPIMALNPAFEALTGYSAAESVGRNCRFLQGAATDRTTSARIKRCIGEQRGSIEWIVNQRRDGSTFWNLLFLVPVFDDEGTLLHFFGNQRDITEGRPADLPDHGFGKADLPFLGQVEFDAVLRELSSDSSSNPIEQSRALERTVDAARRLNEITTHLMPAPWSPY